MSEHATEAICHETDVGRIGLLRNNFVEKYCHVESHLRDVRSTRTNRGATEHLRVFATNSEVSIINYTYYISITM